jgi:hypothetical protein
MSYNHYVGTNDVSENNNLILNLGLGVMFLKDKRAELKISGYDLLNQNNAYSQNVTSAYVERVYSNVLKRYFLLSFTYNIKSFNADADSNKGGMPHPPF